jgi:predicted DNA-binding transcriptional regulator YafY
VLTFNYRKRSGEEGKRTIHVRQVFEYRSLYSGRESYLIKGYCTTHNAERTFNDYRIRNLIDMQTGQIYDIGREFVLPIFHAWYEKNQKRKILRLRYWLLNKRGQIGNLPIIHKFSTGIRRLRHRSYDYDEW